MHTQAGGCSRRHDLLGPSPLPALCWWSTVHASSRLHAQPRQQAIQASPAAVHSSGVDRSALVASSSSSSSGPGQQHIRAPAPHLLEELPGDPFQYLDEFEALAVASLRALHGGMCISPPAQQEVRCGVFRLCSYFGGIAIKVEIESLGTAC